MKNLYTILMLAFMSLSNIPTFGQAPAWQWAKRAGGTNDETGYGIAADAYGNTYITGKFRGSAITFGSTVLTNASFNSADIFVVKYDASGNVLWAKRAGGSSDDGAYSIASDANGNSYITGYFQSSAITFGTTTLTNAGGADIFIAKYDPSGNVLWAKKAGGASEDFGEGIATDAYGNSYITGYFQSTAITFGSTTLSNAGGNDIYLAKYDSSDNVVWAKSAGGINYEETLVLPLTQSEILISQVFLKVLLLLSAAPL